MSIYDYFKIDLLYLTLVSFCIKTNTINAHRDATASNFNVILVVFDDLRPSIGRYGDKLAKTPNLDRFIEKSFHFTRAYTQQALCAPSRNSFLTSRRPDTLRLYDFYSYWRTFVGNFTTLPQYFKEQGYYTYAAGKIFHPNISSNNTDDYPLSWSEPPFHSQAEKFMNSPVCPDASGVLRKNLICPVDLQTQPFKTLPDIESVHEAIRFVDSQQHNHTPYFFGLGFYKPHINFRFPRQYIDYFNLSDFQNYTQDIFKPHDVPNVAWNPYTDVRSRDDFKHMNIKFPYGPISELQRAQIRQGYYASVTYVDDLFGKFLSHVDLNRTILMVTSDHGWSLGEHAEWAKYSNFEVALRVPLIVYSPEIPLTESRRIDTPTELVDIFPTLVDLAGLPPIPKCQRHQQNQINLWHLPSNQQNEKLLTCTEGKSLVSLLKGGFDSNKQQYVALSQYPRPGIQPTKHPNSDKPKLKNIRVMGYSIRTEDFRYTLWVRFFAHNFTRDWTSIYGEELYDHRFDDNEEINLYELNEFNEIRLLLKQKLINSFEGISID